MMTNMIKNATANHVSCEIGYILLGEKINGIWHAKMTWRRTGSPVSVDFDWQKVMDREETRGDVVGFFHTHPKGLNSPSARDKKTMNAWSTCFGKPLLCLIDDGHGTYGWIYNAQDETVSTVNKTAIFRRKVVVAVE
ncbi:MAG: Mov34/MPN/PAD-1 family protein [Candidatus Obscuribacterales bacterium]|nr:Mov34/MPN/PAD-1 family protein [Candidatus Obscuribacterales bacterium]